jgi:hypothetical protein
MRRRRTHVTTLAMALAMTLSITAAASAADLYVSPSGSDGASCAPSAPCASVNRAYRAAKPGQVVEVAAGSYGSQSITYDGSKAAGPNVVIQPAPGASVSFGSLNIFTTHLTVQNIDTGYVDIEKGSGGQPATDITVRNGDGDGLFIGGGSARILIEGGSYGNRTNEAPVKVQGSPAPTDITFDGVVFHDAVRTQEAVHMECIYAADVQRFTIRNSHFRNCAIMDLFITKLSGVDPQDVLIENNFFDKTGSHSGGLSKGYYALMVGPAIGTARNIVVRNNSFLQGMSFQAGSMPGSRVVNNVGEAGSCRSGLSYGRNVWNDTKCGGSDKVAPSGFVNPGNYDLHLVPGAAAIGYADASDVPAVDIDGGQRPAGGAPDAGADEYGSVRSTGGPPASGGPTPPATTGSGAAPATRKRTATRTRLRLGGRARTARKRVRHRRLAGRVTRARGGRVRVVLQRRVGGKWRHVKTVSVKVGHKGRFAARLRVHAKRRYRAFARYGGSRTLRPSVSRRVTFRG